LDERLVGHVHVRVCRAVEDERAAIRRLVGELARQPCLATTGLARHEDDLTALSPLCERERRAERRQLLVAADEGEGRARPQRSGQLDRVADERRRRSQRSVLFEDRPLELAQSLTRLDPELVERGARVAIGVERLRLAAGTIEREHQLAAETLAVRM